MVILLATYNGEKYLRQQLDSLFEQSNQDFRIVIHDDGSLDNTTAIINEYCEKYTDRIEILYGETCGGPKDNFLWMLSKVCADYYFLCDQDDVWYSDKVNKSMERLLYLEHHSPANEPICIFTDMEVVDENLNSLSTSFIRYIGREPSYTKYTQILIDNPAAGCTMCFNKALRDLVVDLVPDIDLKNVPMHDALVLEIAAIMGQVEAIDEPLVKYRQTGQNTMGAVTESNSDKANRNIEDLQKGNIKDKKKEFVNESRLFAEEILKAKWLPSDKKNILIRFANISKKCKLKRMSFYKKYDFTRAHHNLWFLLWV